MNIDKEFLNHLTVESSAQYILKESVSDTLIGDPDTKKVYEFLVEYFGKSGSLPSSQVLTTQFPDVAFERPNSSVEWIVDSLRTRYKKTELYDLLMEVADKQDSPEEGFKTLRERCSIIEANTLSKRNVWDIKEDFNLFFDEYKDDIIQNGTRQGLSLGFKEIDAFTGGLKPGRLGFIAARPKRMKTFFMLQAFLSQIKQGYNPVFFTLELLEEEIFLRLLCMVTGFSFDKAEKGNIASKEEWKFLEEEWNKFTSNLKSTPKIIMPDPESRTVAQMIMLADKLDADSILISQLKQIAPVRYHKNRWDDYNEIVLELKNAAIRPGVERPILVEAQINREGQNIGEMADMDLAYLGLTDAIGQTSDVVFGIAQSKDHKAQSTLEFGIIEARNHGREAWVFEYDFIKQTKIRLIGVA